MMQTGKPQPGQVMKYPRAVPRVKLVKHNDHLAVAKEVNEFIEKLQTEQRLGNASIDVKVLEDGKLFFATVAYEEIVQFDLVDAATGQYLGSETPSGIRSQPGIQLLS